MDSYLSLKGRGLTKRKKFISRARDRIWSGNPSIQGPLFTLERGNFQPGLFNY